eukprot:CAMPEP_0113520974 /NCGR_PEP_ID=MMETSP0014_2-20120614/44388_1 /TAXON_ID=2857 /ORGANISM="Nitzschia sp." /LENGTH=644 /DNA_ID=CAMNT_0000418893 /DNA_START=599 /DNA_END=2533 /DNA_ORIENTATION=- /assembly_acc=CAM_ASM_000159
MALLLTTSTTSMAMLLLLFLISFASTNLVLFVEGNTPGICNPLSVEDECANEGCFVCPSGDGDSSNNGGGNIRCRVDETFCRANNNNGNAGGGAGGNAGGGAGGNEESRVCFSIRDELECTNTECTVCEGTDINGRPPLCRPSEDKCPSAIGTGSGGSGSGSGNQQQLCHRIRDQEDCETEGCFFCADQGLCRVAEEACPGNGGRNPCKGLAEDECSTSEGDTCTWCDDAAICIGSRAPRCPGPNDGERPFNPCLEFVDEGQCIAGTSAKCRWCPDDNACRIGKASCSDGSAGVVGNPCKDATASDTCGAITGCVWCQNNNKCKRGVERCEEGDGDGPVRGNPCRQFDEAECTEDNNCQWCTEQSRCKKTDDVCDAPSNDVDFDVDFEQGGFQVFNGGLGVADEDRVRVMLKHIFEVAGDSETRLGPSFIDLENRPFFVSQEEGTFFGDMTARKITFEVPVDDVGNLSLEVFFMMEDGTITSPTGEEFDVKEGDIKFNINSESWNFCDAVSNPCGDGTVPSSEYLDVALEVLGKLPQPEEDDVDGSVFFLGGDIPMKLTNQLVVDGEVDVMPEGFPRIESSDQGTVVVFRFPRFNQNLIYDPTIGTGELATKSDPGSVASSVHPSSCFVFAVSMLLSGMTMVTV